MDKNTHMTILYDIYGKLLSDKQREYFEAYYFDNLSLSEISDNLNVSRSAIQKQLKSIEILLNDYELKLKLNEKNNKLNRIINDIDDIKLKEKLNNINNI
jgi:hypothetical protein